MRRSPFEKAGLLFLESLPLFGGHATFRVRSKAQSDSPFVNLQEQVLRGTPDKTATIWLSCGLNLASRTGLKSTVPSRSVKTFGWSGVTYR